MPQNEIEVRFIPAVELRVSGDDAKPMISGYAALFGSRSADLGGFVEVIRPGAFKRSIEAGGDVMGRYNHELMLGRTSNGTTRVIEDEKGLRYEIDPPTDSPAVQHPVALMRRGDVKGSSFAFRTVKDEWRKEAGIQIRELVDVELIDVGPVDRPAYAETATAGTVSVRALERAEELRAQDAGAKPSKIGKSAVACTEHFKACTDAARTCIDIIAATSDDPSDADTAACNEAARYARVCVTTVCQAMESCARITGDYGYYRSLREDLLKAEHRAASAATQPAEDDDQRSRLQRQAEASI